MPTDGTGTLLVPTARAVAAELVPDFGEIPSALIPLASRPALSYVLERFSDSGLAPVVAAHVGLDQVLAYASHQSTPPVAVIDVGDTPSLGHTVLTALERLGDLHGRLVINFGDTLVEDPLPPGDVVFYARQADIHRWTVFEMDAAASITRVIDKDTPKQGGESLLVFVGLFGIADPTAFRAALRAACAGSTDSLDPFYLALQRYLAAVPAARRSVVEARAWRDFGHLDTYSATKRSMSTGARAFNRVSIDERRGIVRKTSTHADKLRGEINWYVRLPRPLSHLAPRIFDYAVDGPQPFVAMEFYGYPALNDLFLYANLSLGVWHQISVALERTLAELGAHTLEPLDPDDLVAAMRAMYEGKTLARIAELPDDGMRRRFTDPGLRVNGRDVLGLDAVTALLPQTLERLGLLEPQSFTVLHGDFCLSNILYDRRHGIVRLIDPRGGFGRFDLYGDPRYDWAKLSHSVLGHYDFFVNGLFDGDWADGYRYRLHQLPRHEHIRGLFRARLRARGHARQIRLLESLLFLSMVPLHADRPLAQEAFLARGLELFTIVADDAAPDAWLTA